MGEPNKKNLSETAEQNELRVSDIFSKGYGILPKTVMLCTELTIEAKAIYAYFCSYAGNGNDAFPSRDRIIADLTISKDTYYKHFNYLVEKGLVSVRQEKGAGNAFGKNVYILSSTPNINTLLQAITVFIAGLVWITMNSFLLALVVAPVFYATLVALLFLFSRMNHSRRKQALMDAEDIICANMGQGTVVAIETNIGSFDPFVVSVFKQFLDEVYNRNASVESALTSLNANCGEIFDNFCDKAKTYERERRPGMENLFQYNINHNAEIRNLDRECAKAFTAMNRNYLLSLAIIAGFVIYTIVTYDGVAHFYSSGFGRFLITLYAVASAIVFIYIQYIQSKPFVYGTRGVVPDTSAARKYEDETYNRTRQTRWVADKLEPLADRCRKILQKKHSEVTDEDLETLQRYSEEMRKAQDEEGEERVGNG